MYLERLHGKFSLMFDNEEFINEGLFINSDAGIAAASVKSFIRISKFAI